ncbi:Starch-binding associating with outer membrane [Chryseobacterium wanjuense]|uniref:Starch-binding associating with outer membrane n=2 Tax=Chryseobacterium wanjuense TaxID=356305 RepID=A0A1I0QIX8_9FLAO|nr:Starch-binding associating with outer membrane [Chryseobacterium wanjuense]
MIKKMKNFLKIFLLIIITSCSSSDMDLEPLNGPTSGTFPASYEEGKMGLFAAYRNLSTLDAASTPMWHVMDNITDIGYARPGTNYTSPITSSLTTTNALAIKPWEVHYQTIARCHAVLDKLDGIAGITEAQKAELGSELRFIRAYCYSQLIELYGDVPLLKASVTLNNANVPRTPVAEIQQFIIDELGAVAPQLPISQSQFGNVRASRIAALMLKARVELYSKQYAAAAVTSKQALDAAAGVYSLTPFNASVNYAGKDHTVGEPDPSNIFGHSGFSNSKEWIWVAEYNINVPGYLHNQQYYAASRLGKGVCYWGPTQNLIDSYEMTDGLSILESPLYDETNPFKDRDPRLDMYAVRPHSRYLGYQFEPNTSFVKINNYWSAGAPTQVANADATNAYRSFSGYLWRKVVDIADFNSTSVSGNSDLGVGIFRLPELLLIYAEAKIELNQLDNSVYDAINQIRTRAKMPLLNPGMSQAKLRKALRYERKVELANDGLRWYDIRRWGIANTVMNGYLYLNRNANNWTKSAITGFDESANPIYNQSQASVYFTTQQVVYKINKDEYWPIPQSEMDANPNLKQNPGY